MGNLMQWYFVFEFWKITLQFQSSVGKICVCINISTLFYVIPVSLIVLKTTKESAELFKYIQAVPKKMSGRFRAHLEALNVLKSKIPTPEGVSGAFCDCVNEIHSVFCIFFHFLILKHLRPLNEPWALRPFFWDTL